MISSKSSGKLEKGSSFAEDIAFNKKADKLFGLDRQVDNSLRPQKAGWLTKKPFAMKTAGGVSVISRKRWFAVKDSFLFWWENETKPEIGFDTKPRGAIPLGGCTINMIDNLNLEVRHPVFLKGESLVMKASDPFEAREWMSAIQTGMQATWENAILGFALIEKLKTKGGELEVEKEEAIKKMEEEAMRLETERLEAQRIEEMRIATQHLHEQEVASVDGRMHQLEQQKSDTESEAVKESQALLLERKKREKFEKLISEAQEALYEIEAAFEAFEHERLRLQKEAIRKRAASMAPPTTPQQKAQQEKEIELEVQKQEEEEKQKMHEDEKVRKNVAALREYFEATAKIHALRRQNQSMKKQNNI